MDARIAKETAERTAEHGRWAVLARLLGRAAVGPWITSGTTPMCAPQGGRCKATDRAGAGTSQMTDAARRGDKYRGPCEARQSFKWFSNDEKLKFNQRTPLVVDVALAVAVPALAEHAGERQHHVDAALLPGLGVVALDGALLVLARGGRRGGATYRVDGGFGEASVDRDDGLELAAQLVAHAVDGVAQPGGRREFVGERGHHGGHLAGVVGEDGVHEGLGVLLGVAGELVAELGLGGFRGKHDEAQVRVSREEGELLVLLVEVARNVLTALRDE
ncbi:uncharacterized protein BcabD6B2_17670 [Babesia caballi]|uniref:Plasmodium falciparum CPW-WPC domain containing protein n=1 Tax=Babesia caballi TaxID=5871 RepID=A0AAV4LPY8_BABCB|nr:Plasmodium falciparum CPW-WPC domain containing protein [Babesia caballi]